MMAIICVVADYEYIYDDYNKHTYFRGNIIEKFVVRYIMMMMYLSVGCMWLTSVNYTHAQLTGDGDWLFCSQPS